MQVDGSTSITLAFSLDALEKLSDPTTVMENASKWSDNIGVVTDNSPIDVTNYEYDYNIRFTFKSGARDIVTTLEDSQLTLVTARYIFIGANKEHEKLAEETEWEYLSIEEAAVAADWDLIESVENMMYDGDVLDVTRQIEDDTHLKLPLNTLRWHQVNRGEKNRIIRPVNSDFNTDTITENRAVLMHRGVGESHKLWGVITSVSTFDTIGEIVDEYPIEDIRPHSDTENISENVTERIQDTHGEAEEYITFRVETVDPEENPEILQ